MAVQVNVVETLGNPPRKVKPIVELLEELLGRADITDGVFPVRLISRTKGTPNRQGLAHINVRHHEASGVHLRVQPGDNKTSFDLVMAPHNGTTPAELREALAHAVRAAKMSGGQRKPVATMEEAFQKMVALCRLFDGGPFTLAQLHYETAREIGYADRRSLCACVQRFAVGGVHLQRVREIYSFSDDVMMEAFPDRAAEEPSVSAPDERPAEPAEEAAADVAEPAHEETPPDPEEVRTVAAFLTGGMTPLLQTALGLLAEGSATQTVRVSDKNGGHTEERLSGAQLGLQDEEYDLVFPILEIAKILHRMEEPGHDGKPVFSVNLPLVRGVLALLPPKEAPVTTPKRETTEELELQIGALVTRRGALVNFLTKEERRLPSLRATAVNVSMNVEKARMALAAAQQALVTATNAMHESVTTMNGARLQDELLAHEEQRLRREHEALSAAALTEAVTYLKNAFTPIQLEALKARLG
ncbi:MAG: hypothetical protein AAB579_04045 [Patescibacteria group bacterium]